MQIEILMFQSSPAPKGGRYERIMKFNIVLKDVSILARPEGRALHNIQHIPPVEGAFQSSPAPKGGRYASP